MAVLIFLSIIRKSNYFDYTPGQSDVQASSLFEASKLIVLFPNHKVGRQKTTRLSTSRGHVPKLWLLKGEKKICALPNRMSIYIKKSSFIICSSYIAFLECF